MMIDNQRPDDSRELLCELAMARSANAVLMPSFAEVVTNPGPPRFIDRREALRWWECRHAFLVQSVDHAWGLGLHRLVCDLARAVMPWAIVHHLVDVMVAVSRTALAAATEAEDAVASADATMWLCRGLVGSDVVDEADRYAVDSVRGASDCDRHMADAFADVACVALARGYRYRRYGDDINADDQFRHAWYRYFGAWRISCSLRDIETRSVRLVDLAEAAVGFDPARGVETIQRALFALDAGEDRFHLARAHFVGSSN